MGDITSMNDTKRISFKKVYDGCWHAYVDGGLNPVGTIDQNHFGRRLWTVTIEGQGRVTDGCYDCFPFRHAKKLLRSRA